MTEAAPATPTATVPPHLRANALQQMVAQLKHLLDTGLHADANPQQPHAVIIADSGEVDVEAFTTVDELVTRLRELHGTDTHAVPFFGQPLAITPGDRHFIVVDGERVPLFDESVPEEAVNKWHLGDSPNPEHAEPVEDSDEDDEYLDDYDEDDIEDPDDVDDDEPDEPDEPPLDD